MIAVCYKIMVLSDWSDGQSLCCSMVVQSKALAVNCDSWSQQPFQFDCHAQHASVSRQFSQFCQFLPKKGTLCVSKGGTRWVTVCRRRRQADPRWKSNKFEVMFDQKGLFQTNVSVHHALFTAALHSYHSATQLATKSSSQSQHPEAGSAAEIQPGGLAGNAWGFDHMKERVEAAQRAEAAEEADGGGLEVRLPELQVCKATTVEDMSAHTPWVQVRVSCHCMMAHRTRI